MIINDFEWSIFNIQRWIFILLMNIFLVMYVPPSVSNKKRVVKFHSAKLESEEDEWRNALIGSVRLLLDFNGLKSMLWVGGGSMDCRLYTWWDQIFLRYVFNGEQGKETVIKEGPTFSPWEFWLIKMLSKIGSSLASLYFQILTLLRNWNWIMLEFWLRWKLMVDSQIKFFLEKYGIKLCENVIYE